MKHLSITASSCENRSRADRVSKTCDLCSSLNYFLPLSVIEFGQEMYRSKRAWQAGLLQYGLIRVMEITFTRRRKLHRPTEDFLGRGVFHGELFSFLL
jgi:hypothetical protein